MRTINNTAYPYLQSLITKGEIRGPEVSLAIGYGIAMGLDLPLTRSDTPSSFFLGTYGETVQEYLSALNEKAPINHKACFEYANKFFIMRCNLAQGFQSLPMHTENNLYDMLGISAVFAGQELKTIETSAKFRTHAVFFADLFAKS